MLLAWLGTLLIGGTVAKIGEIMRQRNALNSASKNRESQRLLNLILLAMFFKKPYKNCSVAMEDRG